MLRPRGFYLWGENKVSDGLKRAVCFIDGFNLYPSLEAHGLDVRAMRRMLAEMEEEKLLASDGGDFRLTDRGIESLIPCV